MPEVVLEGLTRRFGETVALAGIDLVIPDGSFTVLLGPSGCGKSTTLRLLAGLDTASAGRIRIDGRDVTDLPPARRGLAMVFQSYALFPHLSVRENIVFGLKVRRVTAAERAKRLARAADILGLGQLLDRKPSQLSGGQQQRVALARAIVAESRLCLMDEPLSNLDAKLRAEMRREIRELKDRLDMTMVYVTHDQAEALSMADQVVLLKDGQIEQDAPPPELYARPATAFAASFIGTPPMNLLPLEPRAGSQVVAGTAGPSLPVPSGRRMTLGVRPEALVMTRPDDEGAFKAELRSLDYQGADTVLECRIGTVDILARVAGHPAVEPGMSLGLAAAPEAFALFDAETGRRVEGLPVDSNREPPAVDRAAQLGAPTR